jgi:methylthioribose-1-phosphate isomerase
MEDLSRSPRSGERGEVTALAPERAEPPASAPDPRPPTPYRSVAWHDGVVRVLDQRVLPHQVVYLDLRDERAVAAAIRDMVVRGAPLIGATGALGMALTAGNARTDDATALRARLAEAAGLLRAARPTAVNLSWAIDRVLGRLGGLDTAAAIRAAAIDEARAIAREDEEICRQLGRHALPLIPDPATIIHHCNTGGLATVAYGTALGVIRTAHEHGKRVHVLVDETRPRLQGARLTAWELQQLGIPHTVIVDGASGHFMRTRGVDLCVVGCDRVAANGDTANKIGTYNLAVVARAHGVPFYVAAPTSSIDLAIPSGAAIPIEERPPDEVERIGGERIPPEGVAVANPAFDVTPGAFITAFVTEAGLAYPPFAESLPALVERARCR